LSGLIALEPDGRVKQERSMGEHDKSDKRPPVDPKASDKPKPEDKARQDELLDEGVEETFPASDPVSVKHIS